MTIDSGKMATSTAARQQTKKLFGRAFYESLGSPKYILAPMVDHSDAAWRILTRSFVLDSSKSLIAYSPMLHSRLFSKTPKYRYQNFEPLHEPLTAPVDHESAIVKQADDAYLDGHPKHDRPLIVQFCSNSPEDLLAAARYVEPFCDAVDLNLGCPQGIAKKGKYGSFLQEDWDLIYKLINKLHTHLSIPVTAKLRILESKEKTLDYAKMILAAGASIITVHGRQRFQKGHYTGLADWAVIRYLREQLPPDTVIFANGNVLQQRDLEQCLEATGADGVMSAEGNLADPTIFAQPPPFGLEGREYWRGRDGKGGFRMDAVLRRYIDIIYKHVLECEPPKRKPLFVPTEDDLSISAPETPRAQDAQNLESYRKKHQEFMSVNVRVMQSHLFHMMRPLVAKHTDIRDKLAKCKSGDFAAFENVLQLVEAAVKQGLLEYEAEHVHVVPRGFSEEQGEDAVKDEVFALSSDAAVQRCKRPWFICQPYIRPLPQEAIAKGAITLSKKQKENARKAQDDAEVRAVGRTPGGTTEEVPLDAGRKVKIPRQSMVSG